MTTLDKAMAAFVQSGGDRSRMNVPAWALTYAAGVEDIRDAWERAMTVHSRKPSNTYGEGK